MTQLRITGMTCTHCQAAVKRALEAVEGVTRASVDLQAGTAEVEGTADAARLVAVVEEAGYQAVVIRPT
jgi:copper chaperone CopZ